jgi:archaellum biogenesis ATPase FlaH
MLKLIIGVKGTGKTKTLINLVNGALEVTKGDVVCVEKGAQLRYDIKPAARLVNSEEYMITDANALYGFIAGMLASNHDVTDLFIDGTLRICQRDMAAFDNLLIKLDALLEKININLTMTVSMPVEEASETVRKYI